MTNYLITVVGPTAIGKTRLAIALAKHYQTEIISADSRQFYKEMQIGTAVPSEEELRAVKHHFIQHISIHDPYTVGDFEKDALARAESLFKTHDELILVGGSGLYVNAVLDGLDEFPAIDPEVRKKLNDDLDQKGLHYLVDQLKQRDKKAYNTIAIDNPHRVIRALEVTIGSGKPYSSYLGQKKQARGFIPIKIGIQAERKTIYERIEKRVDNMMTEGLLDEAQGLKQWKHLNALNTVGYKELFQFFEDKISLEEAISEIKKNTRRFAKRQLTWLRKDKSIMWVDYQTPSGDIIAQIERIKKANL